MDTVFIYRSWAHDFYVIYLSLYAGVAFPLDFRVRIWHVCLKI